MPLWQLPFYTLGRWKQEHLKIPECKICFSCGHVTNRQWCGAKQTEYCRESGILTVYHICTHRLPPKPNTKKYRHQVKEAVLRNSSLGAHAIQQTEAGEAVAAGDIQEAWRRAMQLSYSNLRYERLTCPIKGTQTNNYLEAVGILKKATDMEDKYLIYKLNNSV